MLTIRAMSEGKGYLNLPPRLRQTVKTLFPFNDKCFLRAGQ
jgi:hypothetical protein